MGFALFFLSFSIVKKSSKISFIVSYSAGVDQRVNLTSYGDSTAQSGFDGVLRWVLICGKF